MNIDSIILDVDGTLWDAVPVTLRAWNRAIEERTGVAERITPEQAYGSLGRTMEGMAAYLFPELLEEEGMELLNACFRAEEKELARTVPDLYPGVAETLEELKERYPLYIVSNCQWGYIELLVDGHKLHRTISGWLCWEDTKDEKNVTIRRLMEEHGLERPVYVGDTRGDQLACEKAGIPFIYAAYGFGQAEAPAYTIEHFGQLNDMLK